MAEDIERVTRSIEMPVVSSKVYRSPCNSAVLSRVPVSAQRILDIGCGTGANAERLAARGQIVDGVTLSAQEAECVKHICRRVFVHDLEGGLPCLDGETYDVIICSHVLEHVVNPENVLRDVFDALREEGLLIVAIPNLLWWRTRMRLLSGHFEYDSGGIMDDTHVRWYTFESAQRLLRQRGFTLIESSGDGCFPLGFIRRYMPEGTFRRFDRMVVKALPGLFGYQLVFVAQKVSNIS